MFSSFRLGTPTNSNHFRNKEWGNLPTKQSCNEYTRFFLNEYRRFFLNEYTRFFFFNSFGTGRLGYEFFLIAAARRNVAFLIPRNKFLLQVIPKTYLAGISFLKPRNKSFLIVAARRNVAFLIPWNKIRILSYSNGKRNVEFLVPRNKWRIYE